MHLWTNGPSSARSCLIRERNTNSNSECQFLPSDSSSLSLTTSQDTPSNEKEKNDLHLGLIWSSKFQRELGVSFKYGVQVTSNCSQPLRNSKRVSHHPTNDHSVLPAHVWFFPHLPLYLPTTPTISLNPSSCTLTCSKHYVETKTDLQGSQHENATKYVNHISNFGHLN